MNDDRVAVGVDLGGTKIEIALVHASGKIIQKHRSPTDVKDGEKAVKNEIVTAVTRLLKDFGKDCAGVGVGVAGQVSSTGKIRFAPNLGWRDVDLKMQLAHELGLPVTITNDVRAATFAEWKHGAGKGSDHLVCLFVGTGVGGGVVSAGRMLTGADNAAGELGHTVIDYHGPKCHCENLGCLEAFAGGWAIARRAQQAIRENPGAGSALLSYAEGVLENVSAKEVAIAAHQGDPLALELVEEVADALAAGTISLVNIFNPNRFILGGGVIEGIPEIVEMIEKQVRTRALAAATSHLTITTAKLHNDAGVIGAAALAIHSREKERIIP
jgi:glucokinase